MTSLKDSTKTLTKTITIRVAPTDVETLNALANKLELAPNISQSTSQKRGAVAREAFRRGLALLVTEARLFAKKERETLAETPSKNGEKDEL